MITKISKKEVFLMSVFSIDNLLFFTIGTGFLAFIYFTDLDGNAENIIPLAVALFSLLLVLIAVLYFYTLSMLKKIIAIVHIQGFTITNIDLNIAS